MADACSKEYYYTFHRITSESMPKCLMCFIPSGNCIQSSSQLSNQGDAQLAKVSVRIPTSTDGTTAILKSQKLNLTSTGNSSTGALLTVTKLWADDSLTSNSSLPLELRKSKKSGKKSHISYMLTIYYFDREAITLQIHFFHDRSNKKQRSQDWERQRGKGHGDSPRRRTTGQLAKTRPWRVTTCSRTMKSFLDTGASSGIGAETCWVLALRGVHVIMGVRNPSAAERVREDILRQVPTAKIEILEVDLSSMSSVRRFVNEFNALDLPLNILIYNSILAYGQSKLANILHSSELSSRLKVDMLSVGRLPFMDLLYWKRKVEEVAGGGR
ncbi:unnamed protein product [Miscanthus lutarioriparius]|uniref:Uncharacterized protein n=1 Tax=Miscanthus lutarioriparius TaxID=422564 RepID=A0A811R2Q9_9POAL|nr:unnamed protein product [Miscanthus lutarioriparius]